MSDAPSRKRIRLPEYDYSSPGAYFVTVCTHDRRCILSGISVGEGLAPPGNHLTAIGRVVDAQIRELPRRYPCVRVENYVIMPNHIHLLVSIREDSGGASPSPTLFDVMRALKSISTRLSRPNLGSAPLFQRSYHEHVIRSENDYLQIWEYIDTNPAKWAEDRYYSP